MKYTNYNALFSIKEIIESGNNLEDLIYFFKRLNNDYLAKIIQNQIIQKNFGNTLLLIDKFLFENNSDIYLYNIDDIKIFHFDHLSDVTMNEFKENIEIHSFPVVFEPNSTNLYYWNNEDRYKILINNYMYKKLSNDIINTRFDVFKSIEINSSGYYTELYLMEEIINWNEDFENQDYYEPDLDDSYEDWMKDAIGSSDPDDIETFLGNID